MHVCTTDGLIERFKINSIVCVLLAVVRVIIFRNFTDQLEKYLQSRLDLCMCNVYATMCVILGILNLR